MQQVDGQKIRVTSVPGVPTFKGEGESAMEAGQEPEKTLITRAGEWAGSYLSSECVKESFLVTDQECFLRLRNT